MKVKKFFRFPCAGITMSTSKTFLVVAPQTLTSITIVFLPPKPIVIDVNCCCQTGLLSCGCLLSTTCCWNREAEILAICFELLAGIQPRFTNKQSSNDSSQRHLSPVQMDRGVLPYKRLIGMCRWMGSHFHDCSDYNGVAFSMDLLEWGRKFSDF